MQNSETFYFTEKSSLKKDPHLKQPNCMKWTQTFNTTSNIKIAEYKTSDPFNIHVNDPLLKSSIKHGNHQSIPRIIEEGKCWERKIQKYILNLNTWKTCQDPGISYNIIKENADIFTKYFILVFNHAIMQSESKKEENLRPVFTLPKLSNNFERCTFFQIYQFMELHLSK